MPAKSKGKRIFVKFCKSEAPFFGFLAQKLEEATFLRSMSKCIFIKASVFIVQSS